MTAVEFSDAIRFLDNTGPPASSGDAALARMFIDHDSCGGHGHRVECECGWAVRAPSVDEAIRAYREHALAA